MSSSHDDDTRVTGHSQDNERTNGDKKGKPLGPLKRSAFRALVQDFAPLWFTWSMNSGIIGILLQTHPYRFNGIEILSHIFFAIDFATFIVSSTIFMLRLVMFRGQAFNELTGDMGTLSLLACWPIAWLTLCELIAITVSNAYWGGMWATITAYAMWWYAVAWMFATLFFAFILITRRAMARDGQDDTLPALVIIPAVGVTTTALTGAFVVTYGSGATASMAVPAIITGLFIVGTGVIMGSILLSMLWRAFFVAGLPGPEQTTSLFVLIGPMGQSASALIALGNAAVTPPRSFFQIYSTTHSIAPTAAPFLTQASAASLSTTCTALGLLLAGTGAVFLLFALYALAERAFLRQLKWNLSFNSIIFPTGTLATATTLLSNALDSSAFRVVTSMQLIFLVIVFLVNLVGTVIMVGKGQLLIVREDWRVKKEMEEMDKEK